MVLFVLKLKANLENIEEFRINPSSMMWCLDLKDPAGTDTRQRITVDPDDVLEVEGSRGVANFVMKWPDSRRLAYLNLQSIKNLTRSVYTSEDSGKFVPVLGLECRGLEPTKCYTPSGGFSAKTVGGKVFEEVDISENEWCEYDDKKDLSVGIYDVEWEFQPHRE